MKLLTRYLATYKENTSGEHKGETEITKPGRHKLQQWLGKKSHRGRR